MAEITVVGIGPGSISYLTKEAEDELLRADKVFFRTGAHPVYDWLHGLGKKLVCFDQLYTFAWSKPGEIYDFIASALLKEASLREKAIYVLPGSPVVLEDTTRLLRSRCATEGIGIRVLHGISFLELALDEIDFDFSMGLQIVLPLSHLQDGLYSEKLPLMVCQIEAKPLPRAEPRVDLTMKWLLERYPADHSVTLIWTNGLPAYETQSKIMALKDLAREYGEGKFFASLFVPSL